MVDDFLDLSRIESGQGRTLSTYRLKLTGLVKHAVENSKAEADDKGVNLSASLNLPLVNVLADHDRIGHVFSNLIGNAMRHTPKDGSIKLDAVLAENSVRFTVTDTGSGIAKEYQARIFEKFFKSRTPNLKVPD